MDKIINERIKKYRKKAKLSQEEAGAVLGLKGNTYGARENSGSFSAGEIIELAKAINVDVDILLNGEKPLDFSPVQPTVLTVNDPFRENPAIRPEPQVVLKYTSKDIEITNEEKSIIEIFRNLDDDGKNKVRNLLCDLK